MDNNKIVDAINTSAVLLSCVYMGNAAMVREMNSNDMHLKRQCDVNLNYFILLTTGFTVLLIGSIKIRDAY